MLNLQPDSFGAWSSKVVGTSSSSGIAWSPGTSYFFGGGRTTPPPDVLAIDLVCPPGMIVAGHDELDHDGLYPGCVPCPEKSYEKHGRCEACPALVTCSSGSTIEKWNLTAGWFRISNATSELHRCADDSTDSPCAGGATVGHDGDGYCAEGFHGPL